MAGWVSPTGGSGWSNNSGARDGNTGTGAYTYTTGAVCTLTIDPFPCTTIRVLGKEIYSDPETGWYEQLACKIDIYYDGGWHNIFSGSLPSKTSWNEIGLGGIKEITSVRVEATGVDLFYVDSDTYLMAMLYELQLTGAEWASPTSGSGWSNNSGARDGSTGTAAYTYTKGAVCTLNIDPFTCTKIRAHGIEEYSDPKGGEHYQLSCKIDIYYDGGWHNIFSGSLSDRFGWNEISGFGTRDITSIKVEATGSNLFYIDWETFQRAYLRELQLWGSPALDPPLVTTQAASNVGTTTATGNGNITDTGGENCDHRGIVYGKTSKGDPGNTAPGSSGYDDYEDEADGFGTGAFTRSLTSLDQGTKYYARAYAHNSAGYSYGAEINFTTNKDCTDSDSGSGTDTKTLAVTLAKSDIGSSQDVIAQAEAILQRMDSGTGIEALIELYKDTVKYGSDSGTGIESIVGRAITLTDLGTGTDISSLVVALLKTDIGSGLDSSLLQALITKADTGTGIDALLALAIALLKTDAGTGTEAILSRAIALFESGVGAEASVLLASLTAQEAAIAVEIARFISGVYIDGEKVWLARNSLLVDTRIEERSIAEFTILDKAGSKHYQKGQPVEIYDAHGGLIFAGIIDTPDEERM